MKLKKLLMVTLASSFISSAFAAWELDNDNSRVNFVSIKKGNVAELGRFTHLEGNISDNGETVLKINLASVDTKIQIRDERMREFLFETPKFAQATFSAQLDLSLLNNLPIGGRAVQIIGGKFDLHGISKEIKADIMLTRLSMNQFAASSFAPVLLNAEDFQLNVGVEKLRELAGLPSISLAVPVTFHLTFKTK
jgi:polyisoprenoid-binding protein YceI